MAKHSWDFDDAMTPKEFFASHKVAAKKQQHLVKKCHTEDGDTFLAWGLTDGSKAPNGRPGMTFFCLSRALSDEGHVLSLKWLKKHFNEIQLLEPVDDLKFGVIFFTGEGPRDFNADFADIEDEDDDEDSEESSEDDDDEEED